MQASRGEGALSREAGLEPWFRFRLDEAPLLDSAARYVLQLDIYCDGSAQPTVQTALFVQAACSDASGGSSAGASSSQVRQAAYWQVPAVPKSRPLGTHATCVSAVWQACTCLPRHA